MGILYSYSTDNEGDEKQGLDSSKNKGKINAILVADSVTRLPSSNKLKK